MALRFCALGLLVVAIASMNAQSLTEAPAFEVASVRRNTSGASRESATLPASGQWTFTNVSVRFLFFQAYQIDQLALVVGVNHPLLTEGASAPKFDIRAKPPDGTPAGGQRPMLQRLLADRFALRVHRETRPTSMYALTMASKGRLGRDLAPTKQSCAAWRARIASNPDLPQPIHRNGTPLCFGGLPRSPVRLLRNAGPASDIRRQIQGFIDRPLLDQTGLGGDFEWTLLFSMTPDATHPSIFAAVEEQLGLKLESRTAPYEVMVIDSIDWPTPD